MTRHQTRHVVKDTSEEDGSAYVMFKEFWLVKSVIRCVVRSSSRTDRDHCSSLLHVCPKRERWDACIVTHVPNLCLDGCSEAGFGAMFKRQQFQRAEKGSLGTCICQSLDPGIVRPSCSRRQLSSNSSFEMRLIDVLTTALSVLAVADSKAIVKTRRQYEGSNVSNQLTDGTACRAITLIFARGTFEGGNVGAIVGPFFAQQLVSDLSADQIAVQGVRTKNLILESC